MGVATSSPAAAGVVSLAGRGILAPVNSTLTCCPKDSNSGLGVALPERVKCVMLRACRYASMFKAANPPRSNKGTPATSTYFVLFFIVREHSSSSRAPSKVLHFSQN